VGPEHVARSPHHEFQLPGGADSRPEDAVPRFHLESGQCAALQILPHQLEKEFQENALEDGGHGESGNLFEIHLPPARTGQQDVEKEIRLDVLRRKRTVRTFSGAVHGGPETNGGKGVHGTALREKGQGRHPDFAAGGEMPHVSNAQGVLQNPKMC